MLDDEPIICQIVSDDFSEHQGNYYSSIWGKQLYPVAFNPLDDIAMSVYKMNISRCGGKYPIVRSGCRL